MYPLPMYRVKLTTYPNNETRAVFCRMPPPKREMFDDDSPPCQESSSLASIATNQNVLVNDPLLDIRFKLEPNCMPVENSDKPGWGGLPRPSCFGLNARRSLLRRGGMLDRVAGSPNEVVLLTGTIPNGYDDGRITTSAYSSYIVHTLKDWVNKRVPGKHDMYVWEYQQRGALHLHYAVWIPNPQIRKYIIEGFHNRWCGILHSVYQKTGVDLLAGDGGYTDKDRWQYVQARGEEIYHAIGAYLSKYLGKDAGRLPPPTSKVLYPPCRWWGCSRPLTKATAEATIEQEAYTISQREGLTLYQDIDTLLSGHSEISHSYPSKVGFAFTTAAYKTTNIGLQSCQALMASKNSRLKQNTSQSREAQTYMLLRGLAQRYSISVALCYAHYTPYASLALEGLFSGRLLSIIETMQVVDALVSLLLWKYHKTSYRPSGYGRDLGMLTGLKETLYRRMEETQSLITAPLSSLD